MDEDQIRGEVGVYYSSGTQVKPMVFKSNCNYPAGHKYVAFCKHVNDNAKTFWKSTVKCLQDVIKEANGTHVSFDKASASQNQSCFDQQNPDAATKEIS